MTVTTIQICFLTYVPERKIQVYGYAGLDLFSHTVLRIYAKV